MLDKSASASGGSLPRGSAPPQDETPALKIAGFGACMITGYPHESGLFEVACRLVEEHSARRVRSTVVSLGGFPAPRAGKYLRQKLFAFNPDYIVIQLGATDAQCPIRATSRPKSHASGLTGISVDRAVNASIYHAKPATAWSPLRWQLASAIGQIRQIEPITPLPSYVAAVEHMVDECRSAHIKPVLLSPLAYGSRYTTKKAITYVDALHGLRSRVSEMVLVDCFALLANYRKTKILQHDGFHLSPLGHSLVGEAVGKAIADDLKSSGAAVERAMESVLRF